MLKFEGRTSQKITIPSKPISTGFKIFALGDSGYIYNWECTRPGLNEGALTGKKQISISIPNSTAISLLNPTQSVIIRLIECLSIYIQNGRSFHLFLNNLFVYWKSAIALKERGIAVTRTVRKGASGYPPRLLQLKKVNRGLVWGTLQASIIGGIYCWLWQDSNAVMGTFYFLFFVFFLFLAYFCAENFVKYYFYIRDSCSIFLYIFQFFECLFERALNYSILISLLFLLFFLYSFLVLEFCYSYFKMNIFFSF
jgi:Transposase IS4